MEQNNNRIIFCANIAMNHPILIAIITSIITTIVTLIILAAIAYAYAKYEITGKA